MKNRTTEKSGSIITVGLALLFATSAFFFWVWYERYLRLDFNELGRYYDAETQTVYTDAGFVWSLPAFGFLLLAIAKLVFSIWRRRDNLARKRTR